MKKRFTLILVSTLFILLNNSCRKALKSPDDYLPKVSILSAVVQKDGSILLTGRIDSPGNSAIAYAGFSCDTKPQPGMLVSQNIAKIDGVEFTATYPKSMFDKDSTYYFRSWAANDLGYAYGTEISLKSVPAPSVTPACTLAKNYLSNGSGGTTTYYTVSTPENVGFDQFWLIDGSPFSGASVHFKFGSAISTGTYTTQKSDEPDYDKVFVYFRTSSFSPDYELEPGSIVYVNNLNGGDTLDITICSAPWKATASITYSMNTRFRSPSL